MYNRIKNTVYSNMLHSHFVSKAEFVNITTALLTQRCAICFLQPIIFSTSRTSSPPKAKSAVPGSHHSLQMHNALTISHPPHPPGARHLCPRDWKNPKQHLWNPTKSNTPEKKQGGKELPSPQKESLTRKAKWGSTFPSCSFLLEHAMISVTREQPATWRSGLRVKLRISWHSHAIKICQSHSATGQLETKALSLI